MGKVPESLARQLSTDLAIKRAVETGTYLGESTAVLAAIFERVETIELSPKLARRARRKFLLRRNVRVRCGDSGSLLHPGDEPTLYWLDAHWSGGNTAGEERECPILDELRATVPGTSADCYLIDDAHMFVNPPPPPHDASHWPTLAEIESVVAETRPGHSVSVVDDVVVVAPSHVFRPTS